MSPDPTDQIVVMREHLEEWESLIQRLDGYLMALDLADGYREGKAAPQFSKLTRMVGRAHNRMKGYLRDESNESL